MYLLQQMFRYSEALISVYKVFMEAVVRMMLEKAVYYKNKGTKACQLNKMLQLRGQGTNELSFLYF